MGGYEYYNDCYTTNEESDCVRLFRILLIGINLLLMAGAIGGLTVGVSDQLKISAMLSNICPSCHFTSVVYMSLFGGMLVFSLFGFLALCTRNICLRSIYFLCLLAVFLVATGTSIAYALLTTDDTRLRDSWEKAVANGGNSMCSVELQFQCSGWDKLCNMSRESGIFAHMPLMLPSSFNNVSGTQSISDDMHMCPVCDKGDEEQIIKFTRTCKNAVTSFLKNHMKMVLPIGFSITALTLIGMIVTCVLHEGTRRDWRQGGLYYRM